MRVKTLAYFLFGLLLVACTKDLDRPTTVEQFKSMVHPGMKTSDVERIAGEPKKKFPFSSDLDPGFWQYEYNGKMVEILFDAGNTVGEVRETQRLEPGLTRPK